MAAKHEPSKRVLLFWYRMSRNPKVQALSHPAFRWLEGLAMGWTGYNNGAIEFTRRRHGAAYGLDHRQVFEKARQAVLDTGLVMRTRVGGRNLPDQYALTNAPIQVAITRAILGAPHAPMESEILGTRHAPMDTKTGAPHAPSRDAARPKEFCFSSEKRDFLLKKKKKRRAHSAKAAKPAGEATAIPEAFQGDEPSTGTALADDIAQHPTTRAVH